MWFNIRDKGEKQLKSLNFASDQVEWEHISEFVHGDSSSTNVEEVNISIPNRYQEITLFVLLRKKSLKTGGTFEFMKS